MIEPREASPPKTFAIYYIPIKQIWVGNEWKVVEVNKRIAIFTLLLITSILLGSIIPVKHSVERETLDKPHRYHQNSQTSENPPFEPPALNVSTLDSGSIWVNGQEIFWRYFSPNTSIIQPLNFGFSFEIWWKIPDVGIEVVVDLSENEGESNATRNYETLGNYEEVLQMPEGDFIQYAIWMNTTYFFANETWASFGNAFIDDESLNLTVGIQHDTYFPIFEFTILRETDGPSIQIIHPSYDASENKLVLNLSNFSFQIIVTGLSDIVSVTLIATFVNQTTSEPDEMIFWKSENITNGEPSRLFVPSLITEKIIPEGTGTMDIDIGFTIIASLVVVDGYGYVTSKSLTIYIEMPYSNTTTTTTPTDGDWGTMIPIVGSVSIVGVTVILLGIRRMRK